MILKSNSEALVKRNKNLLWQGAVVLSRFWFKLFESEVC